MYSSVSERAVSSQWFFDNISVLLRRLYASINTPPVLDMEEFFPAHRQILDNFEAIRDEAVAIFQANPNVPRFHDISSTQYRISDNDGKNWRMFLVKSYGRLIRGNADMTPTLTRFLRANPHVTTAALSYLDPGKHIPPHKGPFRGILRYHICLMAPDTQSDNPPWLAVDGTRYPYAEGGDLLWDDTFLHEVLNPGPNPRIALLLDVKRPVPRLFHKALFNITLFGGWVYTRVNERSLRITTSQPAPENG
ncbi:aspartyl/asparaginyl beta-hydroxylase domain-containing protein [Abyssibius alkaniclasticus]|uniref:aspartyl/asparaginyl beta-hydroxylase domain-containing protein n=1 Tax=Abyssibius alkaniclasticus TaxID=2881234 RepID=UPI002364441B|nr:aspartyl/asparaginyl beta-hydroxylase domain-containing protein [Abyssibius alkaniclasticus]UPH70773.1 aspartyl/asparaginyl beta-hydroxylase domain-containing protein [Abyssibius alkaniclasticus]